MVLRFIILSAIVAIAHAGHLRSDILAPTLAIDHGNAHLGESHYVPSEGSNPAYEFKYGVHDSYTGDSKSAHEIRNGDFVQGTYSLNDADGTRRTVDYTSTPFTGFEATVSKEPIASVLPAHEQIIAHEPILAKTFVEPAAPARLVNYQTRPAFVGTPEILPAPAPATVIEPHSFNRLALPSSNLHLGSDLRLSPLAPSLRYAAEGLPIDIAGPLATPIHRFAPEGLPIGLHEPVHRFDAGYYPEFRFAAEGLPIGLHEPVHRFGAGYLSERHLAAEGLPIGLHEPVHRFGAGYLPERYAAEGLPIGLHEPVHRFGAGYYPEHRFAAEGLPIGLHEPVHRFDAGYYPEHRYAAEGLPIAIPEPVHFARHDAGLTGEIVDGFAAGVRSYTANAPTLLKSW